MSQKATMDPAPTLGGLAPEQVEAIDAARSRRVERRELITESATASAFLLAAVTWWASAGFPAPGLPALSLGLIGAALLRLGFEVGEGVTSPVVLALVPMLLLLPPAAVPLVFAAAQLAARVPDVVAGRAPAYRVMFGLGDSWFAIAPALVVAQTGVHPAALVIALALVAQMAADFAISALRGWAAGGGSASARNGAATPGSTRSTPCSRRSRCSPRWSLRTSRSRSSPWLRWPR